MDNYETILNRVAEQTIQTMEKSKNETNQMSQNETDNVLNSIGLEVQRQGGY